MNEYSKNIAVTLSILFIAFWAIQNGIFTKVKPWSPVSSSSEKSGFEVSYLSLGSWIQKGTLSYDYHFVDKSLSLAPSQLSGEVRVRLAHSGKADYAHLDHLALRVGNAEISPDIVTDISDGRDLTAKASLLDNDVVDVTRHVIEAVWKNVPGGNRSLILNAREEILAELPGQAFSIPVRFDPDNADTFSAYTLNGDSGLFVDGRMDDRDNLSTPFARVFMEPVSGHPPGYTSVYVKNDSTHLYVAADFVVDNTVDKEDWGRVYVSTKDGVKIFELSEKESNIGIYSYTYTANVSYEHVFYEFKIPFSELGVKFGEKILLGIKLYGTSTGSDGGGAGSGAGGGASGGDGTGGDGGQGGNQSGQSDPGPGTDSTGGVGAGGTNGPSGDPGTGTGSGGVGTGGSSNSDNATPSEQAGLGTGPAAAAAKGETASTAASSGNVSSQLGQPVGTVTSKEPTSIAAAEEQATQQALANNPPQSMIDTQAMQNVAMNQMKVGFVAGMVEEGLLDPKEAYLGPEPQKSGDKVNQSTPFDAVVAAVQDIIDVLANQNDVLAGSSGNNSVVGGSGTDVPEFDPFAGPNETGANQGPASQGGQQQNDVSSGGQTTGGFSTNPTDQSNQLGQPELQGLGMALGGAGPTIGQSPSGGYLDPAAALAQLGPQALIDAALAAPHPSVGGTGAGTVSFTTAVLDNNTPGIVGGLQSSGATTQQLVEYLATLVNQDKVSPIDAVTIADATLGTTAGTALAVQLGVPVSTIVTNTQPPQSIVQNTQEAPGVIPQLPQTPAATPQRTEEEQQTPDVSNVLGGYFAPTPVTDFISNLSSTFSLTPTAPNPQQQQNQTSATAPLSLGGYVVDLSAPTTPSYLDSLAEQSTALLADFGSTYNPSPTPTQSVETTGSSATGIAPGGSTAIALGAQALATLSEASKNPTAIAGVGATSGAALGFVVGGPVGAVVGGVLGGAATYGAYLAGLNSATPSQSQTPTDEGQSLPSTMEGFGMFSLTEIPDTPTSQPIESSPGVVQSFLDGVNTSLGFAAGLAGYLGYNIATYLAGPTPTPNPSVTVGIPSETTQDAALNSKESGPPGVSLPDLPSTNMTVTDATPVDNIEDSPAQATPNTPEITADTKLDIPDLGPAPAQPKGAVPGAGLIAVVQAIINSPSIPAIQAVKDQVAQAYSIVAPPVEAVGKAIAVGSQAVVEVVGNSVTGVVDVFSNPAGPVVGGAQALQGLAETAQQFGQVAENISVGIAELLSPTEAQIGVQMNVGGVLVGIETQGAFKDVLSAPNVAAALSQLNVSIAGAPVDSAKLGALIQSASAPNPTFSSVQPAATAFLQSLDQTQLGALKNLEGQAYQAITGWTGYPGIIDGFLGYGNFNSSNPEATKESQQAISQLNGVMAIVGMMLNSSTVAAPVTPETPALETTVDKSTGLPGLPGQQQPSVVSATQEPASPAPALSTQPAEIQTPGIQSAAPVSVPGAAYQTTSNVLNVLSTGATFINTFAIAIPGVGPVLSAAAGTMQDYADRALVQGVVSQERIDAVSAPFGGYQGLLEAKNNVATAEQTKESGQLQGLAGQASTAWAGLVSEAKSIVESREQALQSVVSGSSSVVNSTSITVASGGVVAY